MHTARVVSARTLSSTVRELCFAAGPEFTFVPGQWISLRIPQPGGEEIGRSYSIASPPRGDGTFEIAVTRVEGGPASNQLHHVEVGTEYRMSVAQGFFTLAPVERPVLMVATGTGVAPLRSMLLAADARGELSRQPFVLLFGGRTEGDRLYCDDFAALAARHATFVYDAALSRPSDAWTGSKGYVQLHVPSHVRRLGVPCDVYVCGVSRMVRDVRTVLKEQLGLTREHIHTERYD